MSVILEVLQKLRAGEDIAQIYKELLEICLSADEKFFITLIVNYETARALTQKYEEGVDKIVAEYRQGTEQIIKEHERGTDEIVNNLEKHFSDLTNHISELTEEVKGMREDISRLRADLSAYAAGTEKLIRELLLGGYIKKKEE